MSGFVDGISKWAEGHPLGAKVLAQQTRIEQLEQALVDLGVDLCIALNNLTTEKALADRLYNAPGFDSREAYRKARGL